MNRIFALCFIWTTLIGATFGSHAFFAFDLGEDEFLTAYLDHSCSPHSQSVCATLDIYEATLTPRCVAGSHECIGHMDTFLSREGACAACDAGTVCSGEGLCTSSSSLCDDAMAALSCGCSSRGTVTAEDDTCSCAPGFEGERCDVCAAQIQSGGSEYLCCPVNGILGMSTALVLVEQAEIAAFLSGTYTGGHACTRRDDQITSGSATCDCMAPDHERDGDPVDPAWMAMVLSRGDYVEVRVDESSQSKNAGTSTNSTDSAEGIVAFAIAIAVAVLCLLICCCAICFFFVKPAYAPVQNKVLSELGSEKARSRIHVNYGAERPTRRREARKPTFQLLKLAGDDDDNNA